MVTIFNKETEQFTTFKAATDAAEFCNIPIETVRNCLTSTMHIGKYIIGNGGNLVLSKRGGKRKSSFK